MTEEQFQKFIEAITESKKHWELLIRIDENTKNMRAEFGKHVTDDAAEMALTRASLSKVHERIDAIKNDVKEEIKTVSSEQEKIKNRIVGASLFLTIFIAILQVGIAFYNATKNDSRMQQMGRMINEDSVRRT